MAEVPIEDFGGLDVNKLDGEKLAFAIITTDVTECFAADNSDTLLEWRNIIEDYLGKGMLIMSETIINYHILIMYNCNWPCKEGVCAIS